MDKRTLELLQVFNLKYLWERHSRLETYRNSRLFKTSKLNKLLIPYLARYHPQILGKNKKISQDKHIRITLRLALKVNTCRRGSNHKANHLGNKIPNKNLVRQEEFKNRINTTIINLPHKAWTSPRYHHTMVINSKQLWCRRKDQRWIMHLLNNILREGMLLTKCRCLALIKFCSSKTSMISKPNLWIQAR